MTYKKIFIYTLLFIILILLSHIFHDSMFKPLNQFMPPLCAVQCRNFLYSKSLAKIINTVNNRRLNLWNHYDSHKLYAHTLDSTHKSLWSRLSLFMQHFAMIYCHCRSLYQDNMIITDGEKQININIQNRPSLYLCLFFVDGGKLQLHRKTDDTGNYIIEKTYIPSNTLVLLDYMSFKQIKYSGFVVRTDYRLFPFTSQTQIELKNRYGFLSKWKCWSKNRLKWLFV